LLEISLHILDIVENSTRAGAKTVSIDIIEDTAKDILSLEIRDNGSGMTEDVLNKVIDPFFTTKKVRSVGLGLPMLALAAERAEGRFAIESKGGEGTRVAADFKLSHIDRQPLGDISGTLVTLIAGNEDVDLIYRHEHDGQVYIFDTREIKKEIEDIPINHVAVLNFIRNHITEGLKEIGAEA
jgi:signal transduction histidine kinase